MPILNKHFNRIETEYDHYYLNNTGDRSERDTTYTGYIKCKLAHGRGYSLLVPDVLLVDAALPYWIQPLHFLPCRLERSEKAIAAWIPMDISAGQTVFATFLNKDFVRRFEDGSQLFRCRIQGPERLDEYATGTFVWGDGWRVNLDLFHHTRPEAKELITQSGYFTLSRWNIQGNKHVESVNFVYFTCLPDVKMDDDLREIAMASDGKIQMIMDDHEVPTVIFQSEKLADLGILEIPVYRESTINRRATLSVQVDAGYLTPQHILRHDQRGMWVYYEISRPFVYRLALPPGATWRYASTDLRRKYADAQQPGYIVVGDATTFSGLAAPFDEENTDEILKIDMPPGDSTLLERWFDVSNKDNFSVIKRKLWSLKPAN